MTREQSISTPVESVRAGRWDKVVRSRTFRRVLAPVTGLVLILEPTAACDSLVYHNPTATTEPLPSFSNTDTATATPGNPFDTTPSTSSSSEFSSSATPTPTTPAETMPSPTTASQTATPTATGPTPDSSSLASNGSHGRNCEFFSGSHTLILSNNPECDGYILNKKDGSGNYLGPQEALSGRSGDTLQAFCYVIGDYVLKADGSRDNRWVTVPTDPSYAEAANQQYQVAYVARASLDNAGSPGECSPTDYAHNPAGM